ncbi:MAG: class II aldolase/adducin family protein [Alphaproteobacteria bacterium]|nr:class II aldolase/adducin family protein [Alphaproteobacteria bacterium]
MSVPPEETLRADLVSTAHALHARGWVANHDGNVTAALGEGRYVATPTSVSKGAVTPESLIVVDLDGKKLAGTRGAFSEFKLHAAAYRARGDVQAVVHAHPPTATGLAVAGVALGEPFMAEPVVSLGPEIPLVPFGLPGQNDAAIADALARADVLMLANHGALAVGPDLETCLLRLELLEHLCRIFVVARQVGGPKRLPIEVVEPLAAKHRSLFPRNVRDLASSYPSAPSAPAGDAGRVVADALRRFGR